MPSRVFRAVLWGAFAVAVVAGGAARLTAQGEMDLTKAPRISQEEFKKLRAAGRVVVVDVRDAESYEAGHIPGAVSLPLDQVTSAEHLRELKGARKTIVTYCA